MNQVESVTNHAKNHDWYRFFDAYKKFDEQRAEQKFRGLNDYSILNAVLKINDEVRLHSRFLHSLLDPDGKHYQGSVFLKEFLKITLNTPGCENWQFDYSIASVRREYKFIDLYITDGSKHIIIENKLSAPDQKEQTERYISKIQGDPGIEPGDTLFVYLSKNRRRPSKYSLGSLRLDGSGRYLVEKDETHRVALYRNMHYKDEIIGWIDACVRQVANLANLNYALKEYRHVVERYTNTYASSVMDIESFLTDIRGNQATARERIRLAFDIEKEVRHVKAKWLERIMGDSGNDLLADYCNRGQLAVIDEANAGEKITRHLFQPGNARNFFGRAGEGRKDKLKLWQLTQGPNRNKIAVGILYGVENIHVGVIPVEVKGGQIHERKIEFVTSAILPPSIEISDIDETVILKSRRFAQVKGLRSWAGNLEKEMLCMASTPSEGDELPYFRSSRPGRLLCAIVDHFLEENVSSWTSIAD